MFAAMGFLVPLCQHLIFSVFLFFSHSDVCVCVCVCVCVILTCVYMMSNIDELFICLLSIWISSCEEDFLPILKLVIFY